VILAVVLLVDGAVKLLRLGTAREGLAPFGVPARYTVPLRVAQALIEMAQAALIPLAIPLVNLVAIAVLPARGRHPEGYFPGQERRPPIGAGTLLRCLLLTFGAASLVAPGRDGMGESLVIWLRDRSARGVALLVVGVAGIALLAGARSRLRRRPA